MKAEKQFREEGLVNLCLDLTALILKKGLVLGSHSWNIWLANNLLFASCDRQALLEGGEFSRELTGGCSVGVFSCHGRQELGVLETRAD